MSDFTFYWHDYETFGADPTRDRPAQFAGVRTDLQLNVIADPLTIYCRPANDFIPHPRACLITGITPQIALTKGLPECDFIGLIHAELAASGTCGVGYNSIRFDDEVTRHTLYRNFYDPYAREWQSGNTRWDIIDMVRTAYALRPDGIEWPLREDGLPSFRLEDLTSANGVGHASAHDALSDVYATIAVAKLIREHQPRLFDYVLNHRDKRSALAQLDVLGMKPVLHVSAMFGARRHNIALVVPLTVHPENKNEIICFDLLADPQVLLELSVEELQERLYTRSADLPVDCERPGLKSVHINKCPILLTPKMADSRTAERLGIDSDRCRQHLATLRDYRDRDAQAFATKIQAVVRRQYAPHSDPDLMLYSGGFFGDRDKKTMEEVRSQSPEGLAASTFVFEDERLYEMLFRYRARNFPDTLNAEERDEWEEFRYQRITQENGAAHYGMAIFQSEIEHMLKHEALSDEQRTILEQLQEYADSLLA
ncbi:MAG: exodeoxyribonuclease I [Halioglobus sp.]|nr:exodeoxyribonuclease I [Halioglobus sp.]